MEDIEIQLITFSAGENLGQDFRTVNPIQPM